jgi:hypothetical protein
MNTATVLHYVWPYVDGYNQEEYFCTNNLIIMLKEININRYVGT